MTDFSTGQTPEKEQRTKTDERDQSYENGLNDPATSVPAFILGQVFPEQSKPGLKVQLLVNSQQQQKSREQKPEGCLAITSVLQVRPGALPAEKRRQEVSG